MGLGFSVYFGLDNTLLENIKLLENAKSFGFSRIFTSLHIPEANYEELKSEIVEFFKAAKKYEMDIICDISPNTFKFLGLDNLDIKGLYDLGIKTIRVDFGFSSEEIAKLTKNEYNIKVMLNASTISSDFFIEIDKYNPKYSNIDALHNFYPRIHTGISINTMLEKNEILLKNNVKTSAFVASNFGKRGPLYEGLPTLEMHRKLDIYDATNHLFALGNKYVFIGDSNPSILELKDMSNLLDDVITLRIKKKTDCDICTQLLKNTYTNRIDEAENIIRAAESRNLLNKKIIKPSNTIDKKFGDITIDNEKFLRYMGEIQILKMDQEKDERVNIVASIIEKDYYLLEYIKGNTKFRFIEV